MQSPWFLNDGLLNVCQPPFLHWSFEVGGPTSGTSTIPLTVMLVRSAVPWTSIRTSTAWIVPVIGPGKPSAAVKVYVAVPSPLIVGVTSLQPRKNVPAVVTTSKRGEPPWHWLALASVN